MKKAVRFARQVAPYVPGAYWAKRAWDQVARPTRVPVAWPRRRGAPPAVDEAALRAAYARSPASAMPDSFVLYRIIGNDLVPRHRKGQSRENLAFILEHEPAFEGCEKRFVVNRIVDPEEEATILALLHAHGASFLHLPFDPARYREAGWDIAGVPPAYAPWTQRYRALRPSDQALVRMRLYRLKNNAVMHNNGARNRALEDGRNGAKWVLPFDGNCFFNEAAWTALRDGIAARPHHPYHVVPMARVLDNRRMLEPDHAPPAEEEPQIAFRCDAALSFDPAYPYGRRPKVELLWRLGVSGPWDGWPIGPWDFSVPAHAAEAGTAVSSGWVARLYSGQRHLEAGGDAVAFVERGLVRVEAIETFLSELDDRHSPPLPEAGIFVALEAPAPAPESLRRQLLEAAEAALERGPFSVTQKTTLPPSGDPHDYWHPAPYYWPHPLRRLGFPDVRRDGVRVPGTRLYEPLSDRFDRTRLQRTFDDTFILALAWRETGEVRFAEHAAALVRSWFLDPATAMNPSLDYAQVRHGLNGNRGSSSGIIEMKDLYFFLDAVRLLERAGALGPGETRAFDAWLARYLDWLQTSPQGIGERGAVNNHGTYYDLQVAAIAAHLGDARLVRSTLRDSRSRILAQITPDGRQPEEMRRPITAHYCCFNLQGWLHLADLGAAVGEDLWSFEGPEGQSIPGAVRWLLSHMGRPWPHEQTNAFDAERFLPVYHAYLDHEGVPPCEGEVRPREEIKPLFDPHDGVRPFWQLR